MNNIKIYSTTFLLFLLISLDCHQIMANVSDAKWITVPNFEHKPNQWFNLRKSFEIQDVPKNDALVKISADSKYWLWINGQMIVFEGMAKRGPNPFDTYYDEINIARYLKKGVNTIAVLVWYFGKEGFSHKDSGKFGFFFDAQIGSKKVVSDNSWKIIRNEAYTNIDEGKPANFRLPESHVKYFASKALNKWYMEGYDDKDWSSCVEVGIEGVSPWNQLIKREIPQWKNYGLTKVSHFTKEGNRIVIDLPYNMQFSYWIKVKSKSGKKINVSTDSYEWLNDTPIRGQYVTNDGIQEYEHYPWMSGHQIYFDLEEGIEVLEIGYRETGYDTEIDGRFVIEDPFMMKLLEKANRTLYVNMRDTYFDCPDRERAQWWGDAVLLMEESFYALDNKAIALSKKGILELINWQKDDGVLFSPIPAGNWDKELPQQMLAAIALGFRNYKLYSGDKETYNRAYPHVKKYLDLWTVEDTGHVLFKSGGWNWSDWGEEIDVELLEHAWYYLALKTCAEMAEEFGDILERDKVLLKANNIKEFVNRNYWTSLGYKSSSYTHKIDDRGNGMLVVAGIAEQDKYPTISNLLSRVHHSSPYMDKYQLEALFVMNKPQYAMHRIKDRYKAMVDSHLTTLWEVFDVGNWSYNHGWSGGPLTMMYKYLAGIRPIKPGFEEFEVFPQFLDYKNLDTEFSTIKGKITFSYNLTADSVVMNLSIPKDTKAIIRVPIDAKGLVFEGEGKYKAYKQSDDQYHYFSLSERIWTVKYHQ